MTPEFDEVLLTAYLDDEVTDAEREKVEARLRTSEASRKLLEELRSVRSLVTQLHLTQSTRSFQQGPWNQSDFVSHDESSPENETSKVVLHDARSRWKLPFQRLASIAALIAIALCGRVLFMQPTRNPISYSDDANTIKDSGLKSTTELRPTLKREDSGVSRKGLTAPTSAGSARSLNESSSRDKSESEVSLSVSQATDRARFRIEQSPPSPISQDPIGLGERKSNTQPENRPANLPPSPVLSSPANDSSSLALQPASGEVQKQSFERLEHYFFDALSVNQSDDWKIVNGVEPGKLAEVSLGSIDGNVRREDSLSSKLDEPVTRLYFRFQNVDELRRSIDDATVDSDKTVSTKESKSAELAKQPAEKLKELATSPLMVEFEIPSENWDSGAKRLRQLGIAVPLELPDVEYLEFTGVPIESEAKNRASELVREPSDIPAEPENRLAGSSDWSRWIFQPVDRMELKRSSEQMAGNVEMPSMKKAAAMKRPSSIRIRVRPIATTKK